MEKEKADLKATVVSILKHDEGFRESPYTDTEGRLTIGYGFCLDTNPMPESVADYWMLIILKAISKELAQSRFNSVYRELSTNRKAAILNMCYQMGVGGCLEFSRMWKNLAAADYEEASQEALNSLWARQTPYRATRVAEVIRTGSMKNYWG